MTLFRTPQAAQRRVNGRRRQEASWSAKAGPVVTSTRAVAAVVRSWPAVLAASCYWCLGRIEIGEPIARLSAATGDGVYGCPPCVQAAREAQARPP
jgi:hypothetical protein